MTDKPFLTAEECAGALGISQITFKRKVARGILPKPQAFLNPAGKYKKPLWRRSAIVNFSNAAK